MTATVVVVDNDPDILDLITALLSEENIQTITFRDGLAALRCIQAHRPTLAIIDLAMPVMDGREFIERLRKEPGPRLPIIVMSADLYAPPIDLLQADAYLAKPFDLEELLEQVKYLASQQSEPATPDTGERLSLISAKQIAPEPL